MQILDMIYPWIMKLQEVIYSITYAETVGYVLLTVDAILSALFTEMVFKDDKDNSDDGLHQHRPSESKKHESYMKSLFKFLLTSFFFFAINVAATLALFALLLQFVPQEESFDILLMKIWKSYNLKFLIPFLATIFAGIALKGVTWRKRWARPLLCILLALSALASSVTFLWDSVRIIQRPYYAPPVESISAIINSRLKVYPFILSEQLLRSIGDGSELIAEATDETEESAHQLITFEPEEPDTFKGYIDAIIYDIYADGKGREDYLSSAYDLYLDGRHGNDFYYIGVMWYFLTDYPLLVYDETDITSRLCLERAIEFYSMIIDGEEEYGNQQKANAYTAMSLVYDIWDERNHVRECMQKALALDEEEGASVSFYLAPIYRWIDSEDPALLLEDARTVVNYTDNLSMYILYGACAVAENQDVEGAYNALCKADEHYLGKSTLVKILRCICADLLSKNDTESLYDIYQRDNSVGLSDVEEIYLIRYLYISGRYDELLGYIDDVGTEEEEVFNVDKAVIKASWYSDIRNDTYMDEEGMEELLHKIDSALEENSYEAEDKNLLLISRSLLRNRLGETEAVNIEEYDMDQISAIEYVFCATNAFNNADYDQAIRYCEIFLDVAENDSGELEDSRKNIRDFVQELTAQERITLRYYMQLIYAHAHFECARRYWKGSEEWQKHIEAAERECAVFEQSSKSLVYIEERFEELRGVIRREKGELTEDEDDKIILEETWL